jgi:hypothetical protein
MAICPVCHQQTEFDELDVAIWTCRACRSIFDPYAYGFKKTTVNFQVGKERNSSMNLVVLLAIIAGIGLCIGGVLWMLGG